MCLIDDCYSQSHGALHLGDIRLFKAVSGMHDRLNHRLDDLQQTSSNLHTMLRGISSDIPARIEHLESLVGSLMDRAAISLVPDMAIASNDEVSVIIHGHIAPIVRQAIDEYFQPILGTIMGHPAQNNEAVLRKLQDMQDSAVANIGSQIMASNLEQEPLGCLVDSAPECGDQAIPRVERHTESQTGEERTSWGLLFPKRVISLPYTSHPDKQGHHQICRTVAVYPIISDEAPVWSYIIKGDIPQLKKLFDMGLASPFDEDSHGMTLIQVMYFPWIESLSVYSDFNARLFRVYILRSLVV